MNLLCVPLLALAGTVLIAAGCGGDDEGDGDGMRGAPAPGAPAQGAPEPRDAVSVELAELSFDPSEVELDQGATLKAVNVGETTHNLTIERGSGMIGKITVRQGGR